eukprot:CAMPEP_0113933990 /NCGR_PEP_ID=MMETSP1339-20121228/1340_1 /TAXON_ID=94617 /ORGANISM="Fibrocapsa japonica" /LENGTH=579 /DNA_ID=CAMNT_0000935587 /DNA_START=145 /DNA_END=1884 /DNA_ORIENTATION=- /assembly_acc=CAM_ASM_000762
MAKWKVPTAAEKIKAREVEDQFGDKKLVVLTGTSSGLGRKAAAALLRTGDYHVVGAVRDLDKMEAVAEIDGFPADRFTPMQCELNSFASVRKFCNELKEWKGSKNIDRLICNAGVYQPSLPYAKWSADGHEQTMQINYLSHFLMISELMEDLTEANDARVIVVGSVTGNDNTVGGGGVYPIADLKDLEGFKQGFTNPISMADGYSFVGAKAYKDSKLCLMQLANVLHAKYHKLTGVSFSSIYPGCLAESPLFREKRPWFRKYFPIFMKYITGGFVGEEEAGQRLFQAAHDPRCAKSGVYWGWNGGPREGRGDMALEQDGQISGGGGAGGGWDSIFENDQSAKVLDMDTGFKLFDYSSAITGAKWPSIKQVTSPCPTLKVVGLVSKSLIEKEEKKRMKDHPGMSSNNLVKPKESPLEAGRIFVVSVVVGVLRTIAKLAGEFLLGDVPETATGGSYQKEQPIEQPALVKTPVESPKPTSGSTSTENVEFMTQSVRTRVETTEVTTQAVRVKPADKPADMVMTQAVPNPADSKPVDIPDEDIISPTPMLPGKQEVVFFNSNEDLIKEALREKETVKPDKQVA